MNELNEQQTLAPAAVAVAVAVAMVQPVPNERIVDVILHLIHGKFVLNYFDSGAEGFFSDEHERDYLMREVTAALGALGATSTADAEDVARTIAIPVEVARIIDGAFLPTNPNKLRSARDDVKQAAHQFKAAVRATIASPADEVKP